MSPGLSERFTAAERTLGGSQSTVFIVPASGRYSGLIRTNRFKHVKSTFTSSRISKLETAKLKPLNDTARCLMVMSAGLNKLERLTEDLPDRSGIVPGDRQSTAPLRPVECERSDDDVPARSYRMPNICSVRRTVTRFGQEMKRRTVMPKVKGLGWLPCCNIGDYPTDLVGVCTKPLPRRCEGLFRKIEHGYRMKPFTNKRVD
jgi:hypothetical protein